MQTVLELLRPALLELGPPLVLCHLGPLLADHLLQVVDLVLQLMLLVPEKGRNVSMLTTKIACIDLPELSQLFW